MGWRGRRASIPTLILTLFVLGHHAIATAQEIPDAARFCIGQRIETTPSSEFTPLAGGAIVKHTRTGFEWQRCSQGQTWTGRLCEGEPKTYDWRKAARLATSQPEGWRLPTLEELTDIVERCRVAPAINQQVFPNTRGAFYWSSTDDLAGIDRVWGVSFFSGAPYRASRRQGLRVRFVREARTTEQPGQPPAAANPANPANP